MARKKKDIEVKNYAYNEIPEGLTPIQLAVLEGRQVPTSIQDVTPLPPADYRSLPNAPQWVRDAPLSPYTTNYITSSRTNPDGSYVAPQTYVGPNYSGSAWAQNVPYPTNIDIIRNDGQAYAKNQNKSFDINTNKVYKNGGKAQYGYSDQQPIEPITVYGQRGPQMQWQNTPLQPIPYQTIQAQPMQSPPYVPPQMQRLETAQAQIPYEPIQAQSIAQAPQVQSQGMSTQTASNISGGIQAGANAIGSIFSTIGDIRDQIILSGGSLLNGLLQDQHNIRDKSPILADQTLAYQGQYNNMYENGGNLTKDKAAKMLKDGTANGKKLTEQQRKYFGYIANKAEFGMGIQPTQPLNLTSYQPGAVLDLTPEEVESLKAAGYDLEIL